MSELDKAADAHASEHFDKDESPVQWENAQTDFKSGAEWQLKHSLSEDGGNEYALVCAMKADLERVTKERDDGAEAFKALYATKTQLKRLYTAFLAQNAALKSGLEDAAKSLDKAALVMITDEFRTSGFSHAAAKCRQALQAAGKGGET